MPATLVFAAPKFQYVVAEPERCVPVINWRFVVLSSIERFSYPYLVILDFGCVVNYHAKASYICCFFKFLYQQHRRGLT